MGRISTRSAAAGLLVLGLFGCARQNTGANTPEVVSPSRPDTLDTQPVPASAREALDALSAGLSGSDFQCMLLFDEDQAVALVYRVELWIREHWGLSTDGPLKHDLVSAGLERPADMSDAVLRSFWRRLHGRPIDLDGQVRALRQPREWVERSRHSVVLAERDALLRQCSRRVPVVGAGAWSPDAATIAHLERALFPVLQRALDRRVPPGEKLFAEDYYRQYAGVIVGGRRVVYVNGFHREHLALAAWTPARAPDWRRIAVNVCDGGAGYFGAVYDPAAQRVESLDFNAPDRWVPSEPERQGNALSSTPQHR